MIRGTPILIGFATGLLAGSPALAGDPAAAPATAFEAFWSRAQGQPFEIQLRLWDQLVEQPRQALYEAAVWEARDHPDWRSRKMRLLRARFAAYDRIAGQIPAAAEALASALPGQAGRLRALFPEATAHPAIRVVLAPDFDAKSGLLADGTPVLLLAVDSLVLEHADLDILLPHELFHLFHATHAGVLNDGVMPGATLLLPLFAEGLATQVSAALAPGRTEGQLLLQDDLGALPAARLPEIARRFLADADRPAIDPAHREAFRRWFNASPKGSRDGLPDRAGYWLGLQVVRHLGQIHPLQEMASWSPVQAQAEARGALRFLAGGPQVP
ncbi:hypothetical protein GETHPA_10730 [Geothrix rubra]|uniref:DUF2268 domain-containing protein n=1 Tax=Geothrix rubra TaxID=2927977 RepID=A0ABQ5Q549_9BACT|nr:hypothetical protein [Geothrix rubra]GLH69540.1 hypothetical protein GETHPA_10730 [Geothrix rubra]